MGTVLFSKPAFAKVLLEKSSDDRLLFLQVKLLLEMLVKKCGLEAVREVMPEEHMKLLTNIRKVCCGLVFCTIRLNITICVVIDNC